VLEAGQAVAQQSCGPLGVSLPLSHAAKIVQDRGDVLLIAKLAPEYQTLLVQVRGIIEVSLEPLDLPQHVEHFGDAGGIVDRAEQRQALLEEGQLITAGFRGDHPEVSERPGHATRVAVLSGKRQAFVRQRLRRMVVASSMRHRKRRPQGLHPRWVVLARRRGQRSGQPLLPLGDVALRPPEASEGRREAQRTVAVVAFLEGDEGRAEVFLLARKPLEVTGLSGTGQMQLCLLSQHEEVLSVPLSYGVELSTRPQPLSRVLAHRLQQAIAGLVAAGFNQNQRLLHELTEQSEDRACRELLTWADRLRRREGPRSSENSQPPKEHLFQRFQKLVAPVESRAQRLLTTRHAARPLNQHI